jgi:hypothetical protein
MDDHWLELSEPTTPVLLSERRGILEQAGQVAALMESVPTKPEPPSKEERAAYNEAWENGTKAERVALLRADHPDHPEMNAWKAASIALSKWADEINVVNYPLTTKSSWLAKVLLGYFPPVWDDGFKHVRPATEDLPVWARGTVEQYYQPGPTGLSESARTELLAMALDQLSGPAEDEFCSEPDSWYYPGWASDLDFDVLIQMGLGAFAHATTEDLKLCAADNQHITGLTPDEYLAKGAEWAADVNKTEREYHAGLVMTSELHEATRRVSVALLAASERCGTKEIPFGDEEEEAS